MNKLRQLFQKLLYLLPYYQKVQVLELLTDRQHDRLESLRLQLEQCSGSEAEKKRTIENLLDAKTCTDAKNYDL